MVTRTAPRQKILTRLYEIHEEWLNRFSWACREGCGSCCTSSVTMTTLEGERLVEFLAAQGRLGELAALAAPPGRAEVPPLTTNGFARHCLEGLAPDESSATGWDFTPCPFLAENRCTVYPARPMGCRAFVSRTSCAMTGSAEVPPLVITVNTLFLQLIEHLDQEGRWGRMDDILTELAPASSEGKPPAAGIAQKAQNGALRNTEPIPGLLIPPEEKTAVEPLLARIITTEAEGETIGAWLRLTAHG